MRLFIALVVVLMAALPGHAGQAPVCAIARIPLDKRAEPSVEYYVIFLEQNQVRRMCGYEWAAPREPIWGCASNEGDTWNIYVEKRLDAANRECVITHEKAHLPPNLWVHEETFHSIPGSLYRRTVQFEAWRAWAYAQPDVKMSAD